MAIRVVARRGRRQARAAALGERDRVDDFGEVGDGSPFYMHLDYPNPVDAAHSWAAGYRVPAAASIPFRDYSREFVNVCSVSRTVVGE